MSVETLRLDPPLVLGEPISIEDLVSVAEGQNGRYRKVVLGQTAKVRMQASRAAVEALSSEGNQAPNVYGVNTGFGALAETRIDHGQIRTLQHNLIRSHACGVGNELPTSVVRGMVLLRAQTLALGYSGVRPILAERLIDFLNSNIHPRIFSQGSVGASGDLAPLAHLALALIGEGEVSDATLRGWIPARDALERSGLTPIVLEAKEGLSLINGTQMMAAMGALLAHRSELLLNQADVIGALSLEALEGSATPFDPRIHQVRPHPGQITSALRLSKMLEGSEILESHRDCRKVQDPYSLRCMPQVHGASRDVLAFAQQIILRELNSATDNPLVFVENGRADFLSGGNFHGQPLAFALDALAMALAELANISERRIEQLVNPALSSGLPPFLGTRSGLDSGFMIAQVTAASLVSENKVLCHPSSVDSIPSSAGKEDHVSMGSISARKCWMVAENVATVLGIESVVAAQGLEHRRPRKAGALVERAFELVRAKVAPLVGDRVLYPDLQQMKECVWQGGLSLDLPL